MCTERVAKTLIAMVFIGALSLPASAGTWQHEGGTLTLDEQPERIVALNWAATEALLLLGVTPVGVADRDGYDVWVNEPQLPEEVRKSGVTVNKASNSILLVYNFVNEDPAKTEYSTNIPEILFGYYGIFSEYFRNISGIVVQY